MTIRCFVLGERRKRFLLHLNIHDRILKESLPELVYWKYWVGTKKYHLEWYNPETKMSSRLSTSSLHLLLLLLVDPLYESYLKPHIQFSDEFVSSRIIEKNPRKNSSTCAASFQTAQIFHIRFRCSPGSYFIIRLSFLRWQPDPFNTIFYFFRIVLSGINFFLPSILLACRQRRSVT